MPAGLPTLKCSQNSIPRRLQPPSATLTTPQPGQESPFSQTRRRDCTPPPQLLLHLLQEPHEAQKMGTGQGVFSLQNLKGENWGVALHLGEHTILFPNGLSGHRGCRIGKIRGSFPGSCKPCSPWASACVESVISQAHRSSRLLPTQMRPPWRGAGLLQLRWRTWKPIPQDVLHKAHDDHGVQAPFLWDQNGL